MFENKFVRLAMFGGFMLASGIVYQNFYRPPEIEGVEATGNVVELHMRVLENQWVWDPAQVTVAAGDKVILHIFNEDSYDHGFAIEAFGINKRLFPKRETTVEFIASKQGEFNFYCSVPCGEGHYRQTGKVIVTPLDFEEQETPPPPPSSEPPR